MMNFESESPNPSKPNNLGGPHGFGDPNDRTLRRVEKEVLIPKIMRDRAKEIHCNPEVKGFETCCKENSLLMIITCRKENDHLKSCLTKWYKNVDFQNECKDIYLAERSEYRATGIAKKHRLTKM